ncbi:MAG: SPFH domain-containing protein [Bacteroidaceae bacterium]|jgi:hypothetical protein|nr:SPFH domain-containing protein [Bacteroidaceae bacterium]
MKRTFNSINSFIALMMLAVGSVSVSSCSTATPDADEEAVWVMKPILFGHGGVDPDPVTTGLEFGAFTSTPTYFKITPQRYDEPFDDIFSNDNTPLDFHSYINIKVVEGKTPILLKNYGLDWYKNNIQVYYRNKTREYVSMYNPFDLISNREVLNKIDAAIINDVRKYVAKLSKDKEFPIIICSVTTGAAKPNKDQLAEMNRTAGYIQARRSEEQKTIAEKARAESERQRALADKAYMLEMNLTPQQFIQLRAWDIIEKKDGASIDVLFDGSTEKMWNIRR